MLRSALVVLVLSLTLPGKIASAAVLPACGTSQREAMVLSGGDLDAYRLFDVPVVSYALPKWPGRKSRLGISLRIDETGRVVCFVEPRPGEWPEPLTAAQRVLLHEAPSWRYRPFLQDGRPVPVIVTQPFYEQILPEHRVPGPDVPLDHVAITLVQGRSFFGSPAYAVHIRGDGWVGFHALSGTDVRGTYAYRVPVAEVARLVALIRSGGLWSAAPAYRAGVTDQATRTLTVRFGKQSHTIVDYAGRAIGMPVIVTRVQEEVARVGRTAQWTLLSDSALDRLQHDGFDFKSIEAGRMLARAVANRRANDVGPMLRLLNLGAPIDVSVQGPPIDLPMQGSVIENALEQRRIRLIQPLIARGALNTRGRPDQHKLDSAFRAAIVGGRFGPVKQVWSASGTQLNPALTFRDVPEYGEKPGKNDVPVALLLDRYYNDLDWEGFEIARWLIAQGNDLHAVRADGRSLLEIAAEDTDARFVTYLLEHGADATASGRYDYSPLDGADVEEVALALLQGGSELPRQYTGYRFAAKEKGWNRVVAWLDTHPSAPVMPLTEHEKEDAARNERTRQRLKSPCWQKWIAEQATAYRVAKANGSKPVQVPMNCLCDRVQPTSSQGTCPRG